ncbi:MAG: 3-hydroxyacyl-CoA dehydrogenase [Planctomycetes bacterium]|nr:3-hydroxyacyl-CoA dehydrogenase [Planctomycetota bacterium]MBI3833720.1 3-hydroxyacyl-CoA dehydrogenase [Planctomycetota bacterium]
MQKVNSIAVIGAGTMGAGIAQVAALHDCDVQLLEVKPEFMARGLEGIQKNLDRLVEKGKLTPDERNASMKRIRTGTPFSDLGGVQLVIEAIVEDLEIKRKVIRELEAAAPPTAIFATNTSSLSVSKIAEAVKNPGRVIGMHFFNPAPLMPLVEIIAGDMSDASAVDFAFNTAVAWGKTAVRAKDTPGFIVNRVARGYYLEALRLLGEGVAGIDEIDGIMRRCGSFKMGPFELMDLVGLDVNLAVSTSVWEQMNQHPRFEPHEIQKQFVAKGCLGRKTGRGFYAYDRDPPLPAYMVDRKSFLMSPLLADAIRAFATRASADCSTVKPPVVSLGKEDGEIRKGNSRGSQLGSTEQYVFTRILAAVINEAGLALDEGVATREDIDLAMMKGTNYPKGPLAWTGEIGVRTVRGVLAMLNESVGRGRYEAARAFGEFERH